MLLLLGASQGSFVSQGQGASQATGQSNQDNDTLHSVVCDFTFFSDLPSLSVNRTQNDHRYVSLMTFATKTLTPLRSTTSVAS